MLTAFIVGVGGALFAQFIGSFTPDAFYLAITFLVTAMLIIGRMTSLAGAVVGTLVISALAEFLRRIEMGIDFGPFELSAKPGLREVLGLAIVMLAIRCAPRGSWPAGSSRGRRFGGGEPLLAEQAASPPADVGAQGDPRPAGAERGVAGRPDAPPVVRPARQAGRRLIGRTPNRRAGRARFVAIEEETPSAKAAAHLGVSPKTLRLAAEGAEIKALHPLTDGPWIFARATLDGSAARTVRERARRGVRHPTGPYPDQQNLFSSMT